MGWRAVNILNKRAINSIIVSILQPPEFSGGFLFGVQYENWTGNRTNPPGIGVIGCIYVQRNGFNNGRISKTVMRSVPIKYIPIDWLYRCNLSPFAVERTSVAALSRHNTKKRMSCAGGACFIANPLRDSMPMRHCANRNIVRLGCAGCATVATRCIFSRPPSPCI